MSRIINPGKFRAKIGQKPPKEYEERKEFIASEMRLLELRCSLANRDPTESEVDYIVKLKLSLDGILADWIDPI